VESDVRGAVEDRNRLQIRTAPTGRTESTPRKQARAQTQRNLLLAPKVNNQRTTGCTAGGQAERHWMGIRDLSVLRARRGGACVREGGACVREGEAGGLAQ
jgi:hypothetical protein